MLCHSCHVVVTQLEASYDQSMIGEVLKYRSCQRLRVQCPKCGLYLAAWYLVVHWQNQNCVAIFMGVGAQWATSPHRKSIDVLDVFPDHGGTARMPR